MTAPRISLRALAAALATMVVAVLLPSLPACASPGAAGGGKAAGRDPRGIFERRCCACHALPIPTSHTQSEWRRIMDRMAVEAKLDAADKKKVTDFLISARSDWERKRQTAPR